MKDKLFSVKPSSIIMNAMIYLVKSKTFYTVELVNITLVNHIFEHSPKALKQLISVYNIKYFFLVQKYNYTASEINARNQN